MQMIRNNGSVWCKLRLIRNKRKVIALRGTLGVAATLTAWAVGYGFAAERDMPGHPPVDHMLFTTSLHCLACHSKVYAPNGEDISIGYQWRASVMANSSRDPYWQAAIRREALDHPQAKAVIEDTCSTCHMPMQRFQARAENQSGQVFRYLESIRSGAATVEPEADLAEAADQKATLAADGVSCTLCHQVRPDNFGQESSLDGGFVIDIAKKPEEREIFGPFDVDKGRTRVMHSVTGFIPTKSDHIRQSELCATCHTLLTRALDDKGNPAGTLPEQVPYQEWQHSDYAQTNSCQSCHMPRVTGEVPITSVQGKVHEDVSRHVFVGGNAFLLRMLKDHSKELGVIAPPDELEASAKRTEDQLGTQTASVAIGSPSVAAGRLEFGITVTNKAGHKFPTAYPARRAWLHVLVRDSLGAVVFESGAPRPDGSVTGNDNDEDATKFEPHYTRITSADQVQIYESIMGDFANRVTTGLLYGTHYLKDNRLLPRGFDKATAQERVMVVGPAREDADFVGGSDSLTYSVALPNGNAAGRYSITAELLYEAIGYRWAQNLRNYDAPEPKRFVGYYTQAASQSAKLIARAAITAN
jgi:nitrate/TMAO reductase-like tetraheme cytochrome c subunit